MGLIDRPNQVARWIKSISVVKSWVFLYKTDISDTHLPVIYFLRTSVRKDPQVIPHPQAIVHFNKICVNPNLQEQGTILWKSLHCEATSLLRWKVKSYVIHSQWTLLQILLFLDDYVKKRRFKNKSDQTNSVGNGKILFVKI